MIGVGRLREELLVWDIVLMLAPAGMNVIRYGGGGEESSGCRRCGPARAVAGKVYDGLASRRWVFGELLRRVGADIGVADRLGGIGGDVGRTGCTCEDLARDLPAMGAPSSSSLALRLVAHGDVVGHVPQDMMRRKATAVLGCSVPSDIPDALRRQVKGDIVEGDCLSLALVPSGYVGADVCWFRGKTLLAPERHGLDIHDDLPGYLYG